MKEDYRYFDLYHREKSISTQIGTLLDRDWIRWYVLHLNSPSQSWL